MKITLNDVGRLFIISFSEALPRDETLYFIQDNGIGGIILFAEHCRNQDDLKSWLKELQATLSYRLLVAVDQEGGRVRRFTRGFPVLEAPRYYGESKKYKAYREDLLRVCEKLRDIGINFNLVPSVDLFDSDKDHVLDTRTFSDRVETVNEFARITIEVHHQQGLLTCGKHFPGLGRSIGDPHFSIAESDLDEKDFIDLELKPFTEIIKLGVDSIMVTHLSIPQVDDNPSHLSSKVVGEWLKKGLGFKRVVVSDDLLMEGAQKSVPLPKLAIKSLEAGVDMLLFGQNLKKAKEAYQYVKDRIEADEVLSGRFSEALPPVWNLAEKVNF